MAIRTSKFVVAPLRGIDQRWESKPNYAQEILNMTWNDQDSWRTSAGYDRISQETIPVTETEVTPSTQDEVISDDVIIGPSTTPATAVTTSTPSSATAVDPYDTNAAPNSLFMHTTHSNALQYLVYEDRDGRLLFFNGSKPTAPFDIVKHIDNTSYDGSVSGITRSSKGQDVSMTSSTVFGNGLYLTNGLDAPVVFDGRKAMRAGYSGRAGSPDPQISGFKSMIRDDSGFGVGYKHDLDSADLPEMYNLQYRYYVSFVNERGQESPLSISARINDETGVDGIIEANKIIEGVKKDGLYGKLITVSIPTGPAGTVARRIYRTQNIVSPDGTLQEIEYGRSFYFLVEIQDNVTPMYVDSTEDILLGALVDKDDFGPFPTSIEFAKVFKNTMFIAERGNPLVFYSRPNNPEVFPKNNLFNLSDSVSSRITGMHVTRNSLIVFKTRGIFLIKGDPSNGFFSQTLTTDIGCECAESVQEVPGLGVVFLSNDGIYVLEGALENTGTQTRFVKLSQTLRGLFKRLNIEYARKFRSVVYQRDREYWLSVCLDDETTPTTVLKFAYECGAWSVYENFMTAGMVTTPDERGYLFSAGPSTNETTAAKGLFVYGLGNLKFGVSPFTSSYETVNISPNSVYENFSPVRIQARLIGYGHEVELSVITNREVNVVATTATTQALRPLEDFQFPVFDSVNYDTGKEYKEHRPIVSRYDISTMHKGPVNELRLKFTSSQEFEMANYDLEARVGGARDVINLTSKFGGTVTR